MANKKIKKIGILTSGGDAPGLNAVIRASVITATRQYGWEVLGINDGFEGLLDESGESLRPLELKDVIDDETLEVFLNKVERLKGKYVKLKTMEDEDGMV